MTEAAPPRPARDRVVGAFIDLYAATFLGPMLFGTVAALVTGVLTEDLRITALTLGSTVAGLIVWFGRKKMKEPVRLLLFVVAMWLTAFADVVMVGVSSPGAVLGGVVATVVAATTSGRGGSDSSWRLHRRSCTRRVDCLFFEDGWFPTLSASPTV